MSMLAASRFISEMYSVANGLGHMTERLRWEIDELWIFHALAVSALFRVTQSVWSQRRGLWRQMASLGGVQLLGMHGGGHYHGL